MKKAFFTFLFLIITILNACKKDVNSFIVGINIESSFNQDNVQVFIDGQKVISAQATTQWTLGACIIDGKITDSTITNEGNHEIKIVINNSITHTETFSLNSNLFLRVLFNRQKNQISIIYSKERYLYD